MSRLLLNGTDTALAQFYYAVHLRFPTIRHESRSSHTAVYLCADGYHQQVAELAETLGLDMQTIPDEKPVAKVKRITAENFARGEAFTSFDVRCLSGYKQPKVARIMRQLVASGWVECHGLTSDRYYVRPPCGHVGTKGDAAASP